MESRELEEDEIARLNAIGFPWKVQKQEKKKILIDGRLAELWDEEKNGSVELAKKYNNYWWKCPNCGCEWQRALWIAAESNLCPACEGGLTLHFYYADEVKPDDSVFDRKVYKNSRPIICLETNERFESQARAAKAVGVPREAIYAALRGHIATKGLHFYYADEPKPDEEFFRNRSWTRVRCKETGVVYESIAQAARETGVSKSNIQAAAKRHGTAKGLHFYYADEPEPDDFYYADEPEPDDLLPSKRGIRVRCVETGVVYKTITQAAKETGASQAGIRGAASGMAGGYRWEYVDD